MHVEAKRRAILRSIHRRSGNAVTRSMKVATLNLAARLRELERLAALDASATGCGVGDLPIRYRYPR